GVEYILDFGLPPPLHSPLPLQWLRLASRSADPHLTLFPRWLLFPFPIPSVKDLRCAADLPRSVRVLYHIPLNSVNRFGLTLREA
ncbi:MAG: hypothetical protein R6V67_09880, partial [Spirochaetia bacterium]